MGGHQKLKQILEYKENYIELNNLLDLVLKDVHSISSKIKKMKILYLLLPIQPIVRKPIDLIEHL